MPRTEAVVLADPRGELIRRSIAEVMPIVERWRIPTRALVFLVYTAWKQSRTDMDTFDTLRDDLRPARQVGESPRARGKRSKKRKGRR